MSADVSGMDPIRAAGLALCCLDLTDLADPGRAEDVAALAARAVTPHGPVAALCVWPRFIAAARAASGDAVPIATVINFPRGDGNRDAILAELDGALASSANEIDLVFDWRAFLSGRRGFAETLVRAVRAAMPAAMPLKVILETGELPPDAVRPVAEAAVAGGATMLKTSTGKTAHGASLEAAATLLCVIAEAPRPVGLKISGGVRSVRDAGAYLALAEARMGADFLAPATFRFGASGLLDAVLATLSGTAPQDTGPDAGHNPGQNPGKAY